MQIDFVLGPAGSGKTFRCLTEVRSELAAKPDGPPLVFLAPKQATFQLERQLLADAALPGFTRLQIVSFERLARHVLDAAGSPELRVLGEEGRVMVLRALLGQRGVRLEAFHRSASMPSFARELSDELRELQRSHATADRLRQFADSAGVPPTLAAKLRDLASLGDTYRTWLEKHELGDADELTDHATAILQAAGSRQGPLRIGHLWLDGFAEMTAQELALLNAAVQCSDGATLAFCLEAAPTGHPSWLSAWGAIGETFQRCHASLATIPGAHVTTEVLPRVTNASRFTASAGLRHLEANWTCPRPMAWEDRDDDGQSPPERPPPGSSSACPVISCPHPDDEAEVAADNILEFVRRGGRFRETAVLARALDQIPSTFCRVFRRRGIPYFLDQRLPVGHHPLTEVTRGALRLISSGWEHNDWFGALKSGLAGLTDAEVDRLENFALLGGIEGSQWKRSIADLSGGAVADEVRRRVVEPFSEFESRFRGPMSGPTLGAAIRNLWQQLRVEDQLAAWDRDASALGEPATHLAVLESLHSCMENLERAFPDQALPLAEWLSILESAFAGLTVGLVPPALDQVLIGAIDRSRNPNLELVILPGWNEGQFPRVPEGRNILSSQERELLEQSGLAISLSQKARLGHERFYAYVALTRARRRVVVTFARTDARGRAMNPSPFIRPLRELFPENEIVVRSGTESRPAADIGVPLWNPSGFGTEKLSPDIAACLYGPTLDVSVTAMERFADCPFASFVGIGLAARERRVLEFEAREQGTLQHLLLTRFHESIRNEGRQWRDLSPAEARQRIDAIADEAATGYRSGLVSARGEREFRFGGLKRRLGDLVATAVGWMAGNQFDPTFAELGFGAEDDPLPAWTLALDGGRSLRLRGKVDRVDLWRDPHSGKLWILLVDYKSSGQEFSQPLTERGASIQLPAYLVVLEQIGLPDDPAMKPVHPAGMVFAPLRNSTKRSPARRASAESGLPPKAWFVHRGRLARELREAFEALPDGSSTGQFTLGRATQSGGWSRGDSIPSAELRELLDKVTETLRRHATQILDGTVSARPLRLSSHDACDRCPSSAICRIAAVTI